MNILELESILKEKGFELDLVPGPYWTHYQYVNQETSEYFSVVRHWSGENAGKTFWEYKVHGKREAKGSSMGLLEDYISGKPLDKYYEEVIDRKIEIRPTEERDRKYGYVREIIISSPNQSQSFKITTKEYWQLINEIEIDGKEDINI